MHKHLTNKGMHDKCSQKKYQKSKFCGIDRIRKTACTADHVAWCRTACCARVWAAVQTRGWDTSAVGYFAPKKKFTLKEDRGIYLWISIIHFVQKFFQ